MKGTVDHATANVCHHPGRRDLARSRRFYVEGFGWKPVFENAEIVFYQMNGFMLGTWLTTPLEKKCGGADGAARRVRARA